MKPDKLPPWPGDCFQRAGFEMLRNQSNPDIRLVHAEVESSYEPGKWVPHAWCEMPATFDGIDEETGEEVTDVPGFVVVDTAQPDTNARILPRDWYYEQTKPRNVRRYTFAELIDRTLRWRHDGPWPE
jgi:hypothetical protein